MNNKTNPLLFSSMTYGLYLGIVLVIMSLLMFFLDIKPIGIMVPMLIFLVSLVIVFFGIFFSTKKIRNEVLGGEMTFVQGFLIGLIVVFVAAIISSIYNYIQIALIDPDYIKNIMEAQKEWMYDFMSKKGVADDQIEKAISTIDEKMKDFNPIKNLLTGIISTSIMGAIISLITAAILKKKNNNPFINTQVIE